MLQMFKYLPLNLLLLSALLLAGGILSGCGKKGPLYLPETTIQQKAEQTVSETTPEKKKSTTEQQPVNSTKE